MPNKIIPWYDLIGAYTQYVPSQKLQLRCRAAGLRKKEEKSPGLRSYQLQTLAPTAGAGVAGAGSGPAEVEKGVEEHRYSL